MFKKRWLKTVVYAALVVCMAAAGVAVLPENARAAGTVVPVKMAVTPTADAGEILFYPMFDSTHPLPEDVTLYAHLDNGTFKEITKAQGEANLRVEDVATALTGLADQACYYTKTGTGTFKGYGAVNTSWTNLFTADAAKNAAGIKDTFAAKYLQNGVSTVYGFGSQQASNWDAHDIGISAHPTLDGVFMKEYVQYVLAGIPGTLSGFWSTSCWSDLDSFARYCSVSATGGGGVAWSMQGKDAAIVMQMKFYAMTTYDFAATHCLVNFDVQGSGTAPEEQMVQISGKVTEPDAPEAAGYAFEGWYKDPACANAWDFDTDTVEANTTLYAKWVPVVPATGDGLFNLLVGAGAVAMFSGVIYLVGKKRLAMLNR